MNADELLRVLIAAFEEAERHAGEPLSPWNAHGMALIAATAIARRNEARQPPDDTREEICTRAERFLRQWDSNRGDFLGKMMIAIDLASDLRELLAEVSE